MSNDNEVINMGRSSTYNNSSGDQTPEDRLRRRLTTHRLSLLKIHEQLKTTGQSSQRHVVPDQVSDDKDSVGWVTKHPKIIRETFAQRSFGDWMITFLPALQWLKTYDWKNYLMTDVLAGIAVGIMVIPQSMSYAKLAGLPVEYGLYSSLVPIYAYAMFGSSRQLAVGPVALVSLLLNSGLTLSLKNDGITPETNADYDIIYATMALQTSFLVGICCIVMGLLRMGFVTIFLSHAVASGFTSGAAIIIGLSQVKYIVGYDVPSDKTVHLLLKNIFASINELNYKTFLLGTLSVCTLVGLKRLSIKYPKLKWTRAAGPLLVTMVSIILQATIDLEAHGIPIVGYIPKGLPKFTAPIIFPLEGMGKMAIVVFNIVIIGFMESIAIAKQLANKNNYEVDASMELVGQGVANLASGFFGGYPVAGSFSRSAVNNEAGAKSGISGIVTATLVGLVLLFLTSIFELMPLAVLASIVISGVISLVDYPEAIYLWKVYKFDFGVWNFAFFGTLFLGAELGLAIAVGISLLLVIFESAYPHAAVLGRLEGTHVYRNIKQYPMAEQYDGIVMVRIDAPIYFANTQNVREKIQKYYERAQNELDARAYIPEFEGHTQRVKYIILEMSPVSHVDTSALHALSDMNATFKTKQVQLCLANPNPAVMHRLVMSGLVNEIGRDYIFVSIQDCVEYCLSAMDESELSRATSKHDSQSDQSSESELQQMEQPRSTTGTESDVEKGIE